MSSDAAFSRGDNSDVGRNAVTAACDRWPLVRIGDAPDRPDWYDAEFSVDLSNDLLGTLATQGTPVEVKTCRAYRDDGSGRRRGRWLIRRANHEALLDANGEYVLSVYEGEKILEQALLKARWVDAMIDNWWTANGMRCEEYVQLPWRRVFATVGIEESDPETVYISRSYHARTYHLSRDCYHLRRADEIREAEVASLEPHYTCCEVCQEGPA